MTERTGMTALSDIITAAEVVPDGTLSRTILDAEGVRLVLFSFDTGQELREHTAAVPVLLQALDGEFAVTADGRTVTLAPGGVLHLGARVPHAVTTSRAGRLLLTMLDPR